MSRSSVRALVILALIAAVVRAQDAAAPAATSSTAQPTAQQQVAVQQNTPPPAPAGAPLTLEECIALAMKKNFDLKIQGYSVETARESLNISRASFVPTFSFDSNRQVVNGSRLIEQNDGTFATRTNEYNSTRFNGGITQKVPQTNGTITLRGNLQRQSNGSPPFNSGATLQITQDLLANGGKLAATAPVERSKIGLSIAYVNYRSRVLTVIRDVENAYYNLVTARENLRIRNNSLDLARKLLDENQLRRTTGVATDLEVASAEVGVANAERAVLQADQSVRSAEDSLLSLVNSGNLDARPGPVAFKEYTEGVPTFAVSYKAARDNYPDTLSAEETIKQLELDVATSRRNKLPTLRVTGSINYNNNEFSYGDALSNLPTNHGDEKNLGFSYSMPWGMKAERARYRSSVASLNSQKVRLEQLELQLLVSVRSAVRSVETNIASVQIASKATEYAAKQYDLQKARFDAGLSTSRLVLQAQDDLESARVSELSAKATLWSSIAELHRLEGSSIQRFGVQLPQ